MFVKPVSEGTEVEHTRTSNVNPIKKLAKDPIGVSDAAQVHSIDVVEGLVGQLREVPKGRDSFRGTCR